MSFSVPIVQATNPALQNLSPKHRSLFCKYATGPSQPPTHPTIIQAIQNSIANFPQYPAITTVQPNGALSPNSISYAALASQANTLAAHLRAHGVTNGDPVCIFAMRSHHFLVAILATLQLGAYYIPQDARLAPPNQLLQIASTSNTRTILTLSQFQPSLPHFPSATVIPIDTLTSIPPLLHPSIQPHHPVRPTDTCYVIFTSGTTGVPKGVRVTHGNVANILLTEPMSLGMRPGVRVSHILSVAFDMGAWEMLGCLAHGAELIIRDRSIADAIRFAHVVIATPTMLSMVKSSEMGHVKSVAVAGEPCPCALAEEWGSFCTFYNACGPTEVTIVNTAKLFDDRATVLTIGKPTPNNTVYVLDAVTRLPCRIGEVGEMWGGGNCVTDGYLGNDDLTHERFLEDPFVERFVGEKIPRMYRTGDLGRWTEDGELEHFGRVDDQVKMKGFRVELDGISTVVEQTSGVSKAVVVKIDNRLVAFVTPMYVGESAVKASVISKMAYYCVPEQVVSLKEFPKTRNGKVDKRALVKAVTESEQSVIAVSEKKYLKHCATSTRSRTWLPQDFVWTIGIVLQNILLAMVGR